jgi:hypothetical protein
LAVLILRWSYSVRYDARGWGLVGSAGSTGGARAALLANATEVTGSFAWYRRALGLVPDQLGGGALQALLTRTETESDEESSGAKGSPDLIGPPVPEALDMRVLDPVMGRLLWETSTRLTEVEWPSE